MSEANKLLVALLPSIIDQKLALELLHKGATNKQTVTAS